MITGLENQNSDIAVNVLGFENDFFLLRISKQKGNIIFFYFSFQMEKRSIIASLKILPTAFNAGFKTQGIKRILPQMSEPLFRQEKILQIIWNIA